MQLTSCEFVLKFGPEFEHGDQVIVYNIKKAKRLPGTKDTKKIFKTLHDRTSKTKPSSCTQRSTQ